MLKFIALLIGLVIGLIAIVVVGGIGIGVTILAFGDVIVGVILLVLMIKKSKQKSRSLVHKDSSLFIRENNISYNENTIKIRGDCNYEHLEKESF